MRKLTSLTLVEWCVGVGWWINIHQLCLMVVGGIGRICVRIDNNPTKLQVQPFNLRALHCLSKPHLQPLYVMLINWEYLEEIATLDWTAS